MNQKPKRKKIYYNSDTFVMMFIYLLLACVSVLMLYPLIVVISNSVSDPVAIIEGRVKLLPVGFSLESYQKVFANTEITRSFMNSLRYTLVGTTVNVIMTILAAYPGQ